MRAESRRPALVSDVLSPPLLLLRLKLLLRLFPPSHLNVAVPATFAPCEYLSAEEFLIAQKTAHWNITASKKFRWHKGIPHYGLVSPCALSPKPGPDMKEFEMLAGIERPFFFPFMVNLDGIATGVTMEIPHYIRPDGLLYAVGMNRNAGGDTAPPDGCAILPRPP